MRSVLLTGFGPFPGVEHNPSGAVAQALHGSAVGGLRVLGTTLDVAWERAPQQLAAALAAHRPWAVLSLGVAPGDELRLEQVARNADRAGVPDAYGALRPGGAIRPGAAALLASRLPLADFAQALGAAGFPARASDDAGGYLCNHLFYELLLQHVGGPCGFVHVPTLGAAWDLARLERAVRLLLEVLARQP
ncbi:MAG: hypothetical protein ACKOSS_00725 [Planctomycetia bacterium]